MQFVVDYQDLAADLTDGNVKAGLTGAAVKTFLENKLIPGAVDFFTAALKVVPTVPRVTKLPRDCDTMWSSGPNSGKCATFRETMTCGTGVIKPEFLGEYRADYVIDTCPI
jgi:hypothetical protein